MSHPYGPGDPRVTGYLRKLKLIASLIERSTVIYLTSTQWGLLIAELDAQYGAPEDMMDPTRPPPWRLHPNRPFGIGRHDPKLTVINSGTEDERVCNMLNTKPAEVAAFGARRDRLRTS